jgi:hypothetical protein
MSDVQECAMPVIIAFPDKQTRSALVNPRGASKEASPLESWDFGRRSFVDGSIFFKLRVSSRSELRRLIKR